MTAAPPPASLPTQRLVLRRWGDDDRQPFAAINGDPLVMDQFPSTLDQAESDALIDRIERSFEEDGLGLWAVEHEGRLIGFTGLLRQAPPLPFAPAVEVGWRFAAGAWGRGFATEAARAAIEDGFTRLGLAEIVSMTAISNHRSEAVMRRLGMRRDPADDFDHPSLPPGHPLRRHLLYRLRRPASR